MKSIKTNKSSIILTLGYVLLYALTSRELLIPIFFSIIMSLEIYNLIMKKYDKVFMQSIMLIPLMGITKYNGIPFFNVYNAIIAIYLIFFEKNERIDIKTMRIYITIVIIDLTRVLVFNGGLTSFYEYMTIPSLYIAILNCLYLYKFIKSYEDLKSYSTYFILGTLLSIMYGFISRFLLRGLTFALINESIATRNSAAAGDPNYFGLYILISVAFLMIFCVIEKKNYLISFLLSMVMLFMGMTSTSRMYYIMLAVMLVVMVCIILKGYFSRKVLLLILITILILIGLYYARDLIFGNFDFLMSRFEEKDLSNGRNAIREKYLSVMNNNMFIELFGIGIPRYNIRSGLRVYAHNLYLEIFICNGLVGTASLIALFLKFLKDHIHLKCIIMYIPLLMIIIAGLSLNFIEVDCFYILFGLVFACLKFNAKELKAISCKEDKSTRRYAL